MLVGHHRDSLGRVDIIRPGVSAVGPQPDARTLAVGLGVERSCGHCNASSVVTLRTASLRRARTRRGIGPEADRQRSSLCAVEPSTVRHNQPMAIDPDSRDPDPQRGLLGALDLTSPTPPYDQIRSRVIDLVKDRRLSPGDRLPTVRRLATDLGVAANTVARAYRELEQAGIVETRGRAGTFVAGDGVEREAKAAAAAYVAQVRALGLSADEGLALVESLLGRAAPPGLG